MMNILFPNFKNFDNVAICPSDSGMDICFVMTGGSGLYGDFSSINTGTVTCMQYFPGYMYVFYGNSDKGAPSNRAMKFRSERDLHDYLKEFYETSYISGRCHTRGPVFEGEPPKGAFVPVFKEYVKEDSRQLCLRLLMEVITESLTARNFCEDLIDECISDIFLKYRKVRTFDGDFPPSAGRGLTPLYRK